MERRQADAPLRLTPAGAPPEEVLVFEVAGTVDDFVKAVARTPDLDWLVESDEFLFPNDEAFGEEDEALYAGRLYFVMANQQAMAQLQRLWGTWEQKDADGTPWVRGETPWRDVFAQLRDIRPWGARDRLLDTGLAEVLREELALGGDEHRVEVDLWHRREPGQRAQAEATVRANVE